MEPEHLGSAEQLMILDVLLHGPQFFFWKMGR